MMTWIEPAPSFFTSTRPDPSRATIPLLARVWVGPKLMAVAVGSGNPVAKRRRSPPVVPPVTVTLTETALAVGGIPHALEMTNVRCSPPASAGAFAGRRVSIRRQGVTGKKASGPAQPATIGIGTVPVEAQPERDSAMSIFSEPVVPAVTTRLRVPWPLTITPFVTLQVYVAPGPPSGTDTVVVAPGQRPEGAPIVIVWVPLSVIVTLADDGAQGGFEITHARTTGPAPPV